MIDELLDEDLRRLQHRTQRAVVVWVLAQGSERVVLQSIFEVAHRLNEGYHFKAERERSFEDTAYFIRGVACLGSAQALQRARVRKHVLPLEEHASGTLAFQRCEDLAQVFWREGQPLEVDMHDDFYHCRPA